MKFVKNKALFLACEYNLFNYSRSLFIICLLSRARYWLLSRSKYWQNMTPKH